ncbi:MAG: fibronectin type III domain-containing protein [Parcubacteria group bacterium]
MAPTSKQLLIILILLIVVFGFGYVAKSAIASFIDVSFASLNMAGVETGASFNMVPAKITGLTASVKNGVVTLTWNPIMKSKLNGYRIYRSGSSLGQIIIGASGQPTYVDRDVISGEKYYYKVTAINDLGEGHPSRTLVVKVK